MARRSMNSLDVAAIVKNLGKALTSSRIDNIYWNSSGGGILLKVKGGAFQGVIAVEEGVRLHRTWRSEPRRETVPTGFVAQLRRKIRGSRVESIRQLGFDRIIEICLSTGHKLYVELIPRGVVALVNGDGMIEGVSRRIEFKDRVVKPGVEYVLPPLQEENPFALDAEILKARASAGVDIVRGLVRGVKVPGEAAEEAVARCGLDKGLKPSILGEGDWSCISGSLKTLFEEAMEGRGYLCEGPGGPLEANPFKRVGLSCREYSDFNEALDELFAKARKSDPESPEIGRLRSSMERAAKLVEEYRGKAARLRKTAEAIASMYQEVDRALAMARKGVVEPPVVGIRGGKPVLSVGGENVVVEPGEDAGRLILRLYREAGELEAKAERAGKAFAEAREKLAKAMERARLKSYRQAYATRKRFWFEKYHWTVTRGGLLAIGGRDASQNESIVKRYLREGDIFLHAEVHGAPATILFTGGGEPVEGDIFDAAVIAAGYSRAWKAGAGEVSVYWVRGSQVSKTPPAGEYLAKGAFMVYGQRNYVHHVPVRIALGLIDMDSHYMVLTGSEEAVSKYSVAYAILAPGDYSVSDAAARVKELLQRIVARRYGDDRAVAVRALPEEEIAFRLPGRARILKVSHGRGESRQLASFLDGEQ